MTVIIEVLAERAPLYLAAVHYTDGGRLDDSTLTITRKRAQALRFPTAEVAAPALALCQRYVTQARLISAGGR